MIATMYALIMTFIFCTVCRPQAYKKAWKIQASDSCGIKFCMDEETTIPICIENAFGSCLDCCGGSSCCGCRAGNGTERGNVNGGTERYGEIEEGKLPAEPFFEKDYFDMLRSMIIRDFLTTPVSAEAVKARQQQQQQNAMATGSIRRSTVMSPIEHGPAGILMVGSSNSSSIHITGSRTSGHSAGGAMSPTSNPGSPSRRASHHPTEHSGQSYAGILDDSHNYGSIHQESNHSGPSSVGHSRVSSTVSNMPKAMSSGGHRHSFTIPAHSHQLHHRASIPHNVIQTPPNEVSSIDSNPNSGKANESECDMGNSSVLTEKRVEMRNSDSSK